MADPRSTGAPEPPPPHHPPPVDDAITATQTAIMTAVGHMFNFLGIMQRDAAPVAVVPGEATPPPAATAAQGAPPSAEQAPGMAAALVASIQDALDAVSHLPGVNDVACRPAEDAAGADLAAAAAERAAAHARLAAAVGAGRRRLAAATALHGVLADDELRRVADAASGGLASALDKAGKS